MANVLPIVRDGPIPYPIDSTIPAPPNFTDKYNLVTYDDGLARLLPTGNRGGEDNECGRLQKLELPYTALTVDVTQRMYDYHYAFIQFIATNGTDTVATAAALDRLMDVFAESLTSYQVVDANATVVNLTSRAAVRTFYSSIHDTYFLGWTIHSAPNVRVRPLCGSTAAQAYMTSNLIEYSLVAGATTPTYVQRVSNYTFTWVWEQNRWRIATFLVQDKLGSYVTNPFLQPVAHTPLPTPPVDDVCRRQHRCRCDRRHRRHGSRNSDRHYYRW